MKFFYSFLFFFCSLLSFMRETPIFALHINIFSEKNGKGLEVDQKILAHLLEKMGHRISCHELGGGIPPCEAEINIFFQVIRSDYCPYASMNWFIPNPEWYCQSLAELEKIDLVLCRTHEVERIFRELNKETFFLGFTSQDCYCPSIVKNFSSFLHVGGGSDQKGTRAIMSAWLCHHSFPFLTVVRHCFCPWPDQENVRWIAYRLEEKVLRDLQNQHGIHLCLSETEGFGHYLMEAMSTAAVVITTDAPPMNEFITDSRCLVPAFRSSPQRLGINYYVHPGALGEVIERLKQLPIEDLQLIGKRNRESFLKKSEEFQQRLTVLLAQVSRLPSFK